MKHVCDNCNHEFEIKRHETSAKDYPAIKRNTGLNMAYIGHMNREYAICPNCGSLENQFSAEARDQDEDAKGMEPS